MRTETSYVSDDIQLSHRTHPRQTLQQTSSDMVDDYNK